MAIKGETKTFSDEMSFQDGVIIFVNEKSKGVIFNSICQEIPFVEIVLGDEATHPPYKINVTVTGFTIKFKTNFSGSVSWGSNERRK